MIVYQQMTSRDSHTCHLIIGRHMLYATPDDEDELVSTFVDFAIAKVDARPLRFPNEPVMKLFTGDLLDLVGTVDFMVGAMSAGRNFSRGVQKYFLCLRGCTLYFPLI